MFRRSNDMASAHTDGSKSNKQVIRQCVLILVVLSVILMLNEFFGGIIVASLGASGFILFITPHTDASRTANLVGSYIIGAVSGVLFHFLYNALW